MKYMTLLILSTVIIFKNILNFIMPDDSSNISQDREENF